MRPQREIPSETQNPSPSSQTFGKATSKGYLVVVRIFEIATIAMNQLEPVKKPVLLTDRTPPELKRDNSPYVNPLLSKIKLEEQRVRIYAAPLLKARDFMRVSAALLPSRLGNRFNA